MKEQQNATNITGQVNACRQGRRAGFRPPEIGTYEEGWAIYGIHGFYTGFWFTRNKAIKSHIEDRGISWDRCKKIGDHCIKIEVKAV